MLNGLIPMLVHDLRTPLQVILGYAEELGESQALPLTERREVEAIHAAARRIQRLTDALLVSVQLEDGTRAAELCPCDAVRLAREATESVQPSAVLKKVSLDLDANCQ